MPRPQFRIVCCLCREPIPQAKDVYVLDKEWQRRYPDMIGGLACPTCALTAHQWKCRKPDGNFVDDHLRSANRDIDHDHDSWDHFESHGTHAAMVIREPWSGLLQGAEDYLRYTARRRGVSQVVAQRIEDVLSRWDARR